MRRYIKPLIVMLILLGIGYLFWPLVVAHIALVRAYLIHFKNFCHANPWTGYSIYALVLGVILMAGLPLAAVAMLLAGVLYGFWEATTLVTVCRLSAAALSFFVARQLLESPNRRQRKAPYLLRKFENHPNVGLFLVRLAPIPDSVVNYTIAASPISRRDYVLVSLLGMIPFTLACVWMGQQMGSISKFIQMIH